MKLNNVFAFLKHYYLEIVPIYGEYVRGFTIFGCLVNCYCYHRELRRNGLTCLPLHPVGAVGVSFSSLYVRNIFIPVVL
jgi:hypothetical protein